MNQLLSKITQTTFWIQFIKKQNSKKNLQHLLGVLGIFFRCGGCFCLGIKSFTFLSSSKTLEEQSHKATDM